MVSLPSWKFCVCGKFRVTFQGLYSVPKGLLEMEMVLFFSENDLTDDQKEHTERGLWGGRIARVLFTFGLGSWV